MIRVLLILILFPFSVRSQGFINKNRPFVKEQLERQVWADNRARIVESDSTFSINYPEQGELRTTFTYTFDNNGYCKAEYINASCDSCYQKYLKNVLSQKTRFRWRELNANQYVSKYSAKLLLEVTPEAKAYSYRILRTSWTRKQYKLLMKGK
jgi:hypothetical protein